MSQPRVAVQPETKRVRNFNEVSLGYSRKVAIEEARRCLQCAEPVCVEGCLLGINIPGFLRQLREGNVSAAYDVIKEQNCLPSVCGRICSAPCEKVCVLALEQNAVGIRALERFVADFGKTRPSRKNVSNTRKIAVVGGGPSGLTAARELAKRSYAVTMFESFEGLGGVLRYGVPEFRLPKRVLEGDVNELIAAGIEVKRNFIVGKTLTIPELFNNGYTAVLLATGAGIPKFSEIKGANAGGVYYGEEFLMRINLIKTNIFNRHMPDFILGEKIAVVGSGNTALDCARAARRLGLDVHLIFRRTEDEMRVRDEERVYGKEEGVNLHPMVRPMEILTGREGRVTGVKCIRMDYADPHNTGRWELIPVPKSDFTLDVDNVVIAIGHQPNSYIAMVDPRIRLNSDGTVWVDMKTGMTSVPGVFACGNVVSNSGPVINAIAAGKLIAEKIDGHCKCSVEA